MMSNSIISVRLFLTLLLFLLGIALGYAISTFFPKAHFTYKEVRSNSSTFTFTNPLLQCDQGSDYISAGEKRPRTDDLQDLIADEIKAKKVTHVSLYYRDLNNGPWIGIGENEKFFPASLMKIPILLYYYKQAEADPTLLSKKVDGKNVPQIITFDTYFASKQSIDPEKTYTVEELLNSMILYSDNKAANNLVSIMPTNALMDLMAHLYIDSPQNPTDDYISVKSYSTFFRVMFNASYLSQANSEKALKLLSQTYFNKGLKKYLPQNIVVSHKFGEHEGDISNDKQLHDCGIVYYPGQPYMLCIMTRGTNMDDMADSIGLISQKVYNAVDSDRE